MSAPAPGLDPELQRALVVVARAPRLLVTSDFDGVLAPLVDDPEASRPEPAALAALVALAELPGTSVGLVSGRARADLARLSGAPPTLHLVGSHGAEVDDSFVGGIDAAARDRLERLGLELARLVDGATGVHLETKPSSVAVHVRRAEEEVGARVLAAVHSGPATWDGVHVMQGKSVVELAVLTADKGVAVAALRAALDAGAPAVYLGDDVTDERAFARLVTGDVGVKVGAGDTLAGHRVAGTAEVVALLELLLAERHRSHPTG